MAKWTVTRPRCPLFHPIFAVSLISVLGLLLQMLNLALKTTSRPSIWDSEGNIHSFLIPTDELNSSDIEYLSYQKAYAYPPEEGNLSQMIRDYISHDKPIPLKVINPHPFSYIHRPLPCSFDNGASGKMIVLIKSFALNFGFRKAQRTLWKSVNQTSMCYVFMLGYNGNPGVQRRINEEANRYRDVMQEDFIDAYFNNTYKTIMAYNWVVRYCPDANILLFQDDDYHVKWNEVAIYMRKQFQDKSENVYCGSLALNAPPYRKENTKWFLTFQDYPFDLFPPYIGGGAYVVSFDVAQRFQRAFSYVRYLGIDDVYLGIVAQKLSIRSENETLLDTVNRDSLAKECSHVVDNIINDKCDLADRKREIFELGLQTTTLPTKAIVLVNGQPVEVDDTIYLSYDEEFAYPLKVRLDEAVKGVVLYNNKIRFSPINVHNFSTINQPLPCSYPSQTGRHQNLLILVKVDSSNYKIRNEIRSLWKSLNDPAIRVIFLLGHSSKIQTRVDKESAHHKDILQEKFKEHHMHSTRKIVMGFNWVETKCSKADLVLVLESIYHVNSTQMIDHLQRLSKKKDVFIGKLWKNVSPHREKDNKWKLSYDHYPFDKFPPYLSGGAFVTSFNIVRKFKIAFPYVKYFGIDDVYLGIIAKKLRIIPTHDSYFEPLSTIALVKRCPREFYRIVNGRCVEQNSLPSSGSNKHYMCNIFLYFYLSAYSFIQILYFC
ncbi:uncharacterized protein LOC110452226 [Mizuhopecten yessoensis]|uniref:Beta-1,3-galactosyltransferase 5 n=1 Tax=Mizuhopecten yessoensis TaxID=6573 RepID=A0A210QKE9_MIZYE|nr:uncharacterized protein LOC110452226 [Mizuhopecten yessoensis]OWF49091.1 Beta-1,3-galactosyltransferase 5 [Mizuhopecten yessoensis]